MESMAVVPERRKRGRLPSERLTESRVTIKIGVSGQFSFVFKKPFKLLNSVRFYQTIHI